MKAILFLLTLALSAPAFSAGAGTGPCAKDRETLCAGIEQGEGRIAKCMKENAEKVSPECKAHMEKAKENIKDLAAACHDDAEELCPGLKRRALVQCLRKNKEKVSQTCKDEFKELRDARKKK